MIWCEGSLDFKVPVIVLWKVPVCVSGVCLCVRVWDTTAKADHVWKEQYTAGFRWEIRNISIFITATWKTLECLQPLQQATQRKLAWGQISFVQWPKKRVDCWVCVGTGDIKKEHLQYRAGGEWRAHCIWYQANQPTKLLLLKSDIFLELKPNFGSDFCFLVINKLVKRNDFSAIYHLINLVNTLSCVNLETARGLLHIKTIMPLKWNCSQSHHKLHLVVINDLNKYDHQV